MQWHFWVQAGYTGCTGHCWMAQAPSSKRSIVRRQQLSGDRMNMHTCSHAISVGALPRCVHCRPHILAPSMFAHALLVLLSFGLLLLLNVDLCQCIDAQAMQHKQHCLA